MAKTRVRLEGGQEGAPETIILDNGRLTATLSRIEDIYQLASLRAGGEYELLAEPSPLLQCYDGKEHHPVPFAAVAVEQEGAAGARLRFTVQQEAMQIELTLFLSTNRPYLELDAACRSAADWHGLLYFSCVACGGFIPTAYPWIAGDTVTDAGYAHANCMGVPLLAGDPRGLEGHILAVGFPLAENYRDLFFHYHPEQRRIAAGVGGAAGVSPDTGANDTPADPESDMNRERGGLFQWFRRQPEPEPEQPMLPLTRQVAYRAGETYRLPIQIWALTGDHRNLAGEWMKGSGFTFDSPQIRSVEESLRMTLQFLKEGARFIDGKGYPMRVDRYTGAPAPGMGGSIHLYGNAALACALYRCWARFGEEWMRERALTIVDYILASQLFNGKIYEAQDPRTGEWHSLGEGTHYEGAGLCMESLLRLYELRHAREQKDDVRLRRAATDFLQLALDERRQRMEKERRQGKRRHDQETTFPHSGATTAESANVNLLMLLERLRRLTNAHRVEVVRQDAEKWVLHNIYHQMSWRGADPRSQGLETRSLLRFLEYSIQRREATYGKRYQEMAETLAAYYFFTLVPKDLEWCTGHTKGLTIANAEWRALTAVYADHVTPVPALHRLGKLCNDRFYAQLGDYLVHAAMAAQCDEPGIPGYGGWIPALNSPDASAFPLNEQAYGGELCVTTIVPAVLETYLDLIEGK